MVEKPPKLAWNNRGLIAVFAEIGACVAGCGGLNIFPSPKPTKEGSAGKLAALDIRDINESEEYKMENNERFNDLLNSCGDSRRVYNALLLLAAKPVVKKADNVTEKRKVIVGELLTIVNEAQGNKKAV